MKRRSPVAEDGHIEAESAEHVAYPALELLAPQPRQQQRHADDDGEDLQGLELPSDAQAALSLLRHMLYPDPAAAAAAAVAARQTRHAKRSKSAPGPSRAAAAAAQAAAAATAAGLPPLVLQHQLFTVLTDRTAADRDVEELRRRGCFRQFKLGFGPDEHVLCLTDDYVGIINSIIAKHQQLPAQPPREQQQEQQQQQQTASGGRPPANNTSSSGDEKARAAAAVSCLQAFRDRVVPGCLDTHISRTQLLSLLHPAMAGTTAAGGAAASPAAAAASPPAAAVADVLRQLLSEELLVRDAHRPDCFAFTLPGAGRFASSVVAGRKELLQMLSRKKHSEALEKELMCVKLRGSCLTMAFHLRDLLGRGLITRTDTTAGPLVRLAQRKR